MTTLDNLKKIYEGKDLPEIEKEVKENYLLGMKARRQFILALFWIQHTDLFKQDPVYKNSTFDTYVKDKWNITPGTFDKERKSFIAFEGFTMERGAGLVSKIISKCGIHKTLDVIKEIEKKSSTSKKGITRDSIDQIINKNAKPRKKIIPMPDWKGKYELMMKERDYWKDKYKELETKYKRLRQSYLRDFKKEYGTNGEGELVEKK